MTIDPVELERLSKAATQGLDHAAIYKEARARTLRDMTGQDFDFHHLQVVAEHVIRTALRTGQLVPAQPSGDVVEAVARHLCEREILKAYTRPDRADELKEFRKIEVDHLWENYKDLATAAITTYEAVSGVTKMREALRPFARIADQENRTPSGSTVLVNVDRCRDARAALGEKP